MLLRKNLLYPNKGAAERIAGVILREVQIHERSGLPVRSFRKRPKLVGKPSRPTNFKWSTTEAVAFKRPPPKPDRCREKDRVAFALGG